MSAITNYLEKLGIFKPSNKVVESKKSMTTIMSTGIPLNQSSIQPTPKDILSAQRTEYANTIVQLTLRKQALLTELSTIDTNLLFALKQINEVDSKINL